MRRGSPTANPASQPVATQTVNLPVLDFKPILLKSLKNVPILVGTGLSFFDSPACNFIAGASNFWGYASQRYSDYSANQKQRVTLKEALRRFSGLQERKRGGTAITLATPNSWLNNYGTELDAKLYVMGSLSFLLQLFAIGLNLGKSYLAPEVVTEELLKWLTLVVVILAYVAGKADQYLVKDNLERHLQQVQAGKAQLERLPDANPPSANPQVPVVVPPSP